MIRLVLTALLAATGAAHADKPTVLWPPEVAEPREARPVEAPCANTMRADNCSRVLACVGDDGLWLDGRADGWDQGTLSAELSDGTTCEGSWRVGGPMGLGTAEMTCSDGREGGVVYTAQDGLTGTGIASGAMSDGAAIRAWTGRNVLEFLTGEDGVPRLPCDAGAIPIG